MSLIYFENNSSTNVAGDKNEISASVIKNLFFLFSLLDSHATSAQSPIDSVWLQQQGERKTIFYDQHWLRTAVLAQYFSIVR